MDWYLASMSLALSPIVMILILLAFGSVFIMALIFLATDEWTAPQRPRSEVKAINRVPGFCSSFARSAFE
jgi:hypothetical protein